MEETLRPLIKRLARDGMTQKTLFFLGTGYPGLISDCFLSDLSRYVGIFRSPGIWIPSSLRLTMSGYRVIDEKYAEY